MRYKTIAGPIGLTITKNESYSEAVRKYADIIEREAEGGWELLFIQEIPVTKDKGCIAGLLSLTGLTSRYTYVTFNMLVFGKRD